ncbi:MAG: chaperone modulator CbpM [Stellaceae bacterium]
MIEFDTVLHLIEGVRAAELEVWIREGWVRPDEEHGAYFFREIDVARVRLIHDLRRDLAIDRGTVPVVLNLLDQLYAMRRRLRQIDAAIAAEPPEVRRRLKVALRPAPKPRTRRAP